METNQITIQSEAFKMIMNKLDKIHAYVTSVHACIEKNDANKASKKWLNAEETAEILNISRRTLLRLRSAGEISYFKIGKRIMYYAEEINNYEKKKPLVSNKEKELNSSLQPVIRKRFRKNKAKS